MKELVFISACPDDLYFVWQYEVFIENVRRLGYTEEIRILLYLPADRLAVGWNPAWEVIEERYKDSNVKIFRYKDDHNILHLIRASGYIPLLRPYVLARHFEENPDLTEKAIFYHDSDIIFTKYLDFRPYLVDDVNYLSDTAGYINSEYWDRQVNKALPELRDELITFDALDQCSNLLGINRKICEENKNVSGGAQYLLKNIDAEFWEDVFKGVLDIRFFLNYDLGGINRKYFACENDGYQSWCADMWSVLWTLWKRGAKTETPKRFDFAWATDELKRCEEVYIYHNAGAPAIDHFNKTDHAYVNNIKKPFKDSFDHIDPNNATIAYVNEIKIVAEKYYND